MDLTSELRARARENAEDPQALLEILYDITTWSDSETVDIEQWIIERISANVDRLAPPEPVTVPTGDASVDTDEWPDVGLLGSLGYKVGKSGKPEYRRHAILRVAFERNADDYIDPDYVSEWGGPRSRERLQKIVNSLAAFSRNARKRNTKSLQTAVRHWEKDLAFLRREYAESVDGVRWPDMTVGDSGSSNAPQTGDLFDS